jgi:tRNA (cytidine32/uridine32-2'-O)-methyltransferase
MVNTTLPANIGAAARAMKTMGLSRLVLVAPKTFPSPDANALAAGAGDVLEQVVVVETLEQAIADCELVFGTSARSRTIPWPLLDARPATELAVQHIRQHHSQIAIVFGREDRGLTNDELAMANYHLTIPVNPEYSVLNVAAAIQLICYELRMEALTCLNAQSKINPLDNLAHPVQPLAPNHSTNTSLEQVEYSPDQSADSSAPNLNMPIGNHHAMQWDEPLVNQAQMQQFYPHLEAMLADIDFIDPKNSRLLPLRLRRLFSRMQLDRMEYNLLRGIFSRVQALSRGNWPIKSDNTPQNDSE